MSINLTDEIDVKTKKGKLGAAKQIFLEGDMQTVEKEIQDINSRHNSLNTKHESLSKTVQGIAATGGASIATNVTYNNDASGLNAENAQDAIDEVSSALKKSLDELSDVISNVTNFTNDGSLLSSNGEISTQFPGSFKHTGYLKVDINYPIILKADTTNQYLSYICFYNADKKFISGLSNTEEKRTKNRIEPEDIPEETRYIIVCDRVNNSDSFVSYHPFQEQTVNRFVDTPKGNNIYCPLYTSYNINSLKDNVTYSMPVFIKRNRGYNTLTISKRDFGYFLHIYFYDIDNVLIKTVKDKSEGTIDIPSSCEYIGFSDFGKELIDGGKSMVNWGSDVMEYEPYDSFFMQSVINKEYFDKYTKNPGVQFAFKDKGLVKVNGDINTTQFLEDFRNTGYIKIDKSCPIMYLGDSANKYVNVISYYDADKKYISGLSNIDTKIGQETLHIIQPEDIPENTRYVICTARTKQVEKSDNSAFFLCTPFNNIDNSTKIVDIPVGKNIYNQNFNYLNTLTFSKTVKCPTIIKRDENYNQLTISKRVSNYFLFVVFLDIDFIEISRITDKREGDTIDIPTNCQYIQFIDFVGELQSGRYTMVNWGSKTMKYEPYKSILSSNILSSKENFHKNRIYNKELSSLTTGSLVIDNVPNVKFNQTISLTARLGEIGKITLSHGKVLYAIGIVEIDDTNIYTYSALSHDPTLLETIPHGLTFNSFIQCIIRQNADATATIIIRTLGGEFKKDNISFLGCRDDVMLEAENSNLTDIKLSYTCSDFSKDIWSFGDSYFDAIPAKLKELGYNNSLFDAYSGRNSVQAMQSLKKMIGIIGIPKIIYWAMGMNDADTEESVNTNWKNSLEELEAICSKYNVELILSTIPNVPKINHTFKNEIVKSSGYKYVDINKAVGADISTNWYNGLIGGDKVHPKIGTGDYVIAMAVINTIPELRNI